MNGAWQRAGAAESLALLASSGNGPGQCRQAAGHVLARLLAEALSLGLEADVTVRGVETAPHSAVLLLHEPAARDLAAAWEDVILWRCSSRLRPGHGRKNWFVQVHCLPDAPAPVAMKPVEVEMQAIRAGGPGGQHVNKTSSAIRARWCDPQGRASAVVVRDERSQHQNPRLALERLAGLAAQDGAAHEGDAKSGARLLHHQLQRGHPSRIFGGTVSMTSPGNSDRLGAWSCWPAVCASMSPFPIDGVACRAQPRWARLRVRRGCVRLWAPTNHIGRMS